MSLSPENKALIERELGPLWVRLLDGDGRINLIIDAARQEGARGGEPVAWRLEEELTGTSFYDYKPDAEIDHKRFGGVLTPLYASPAEPSGWRPIERLKSWQGGMETEGPNAGEFTASMVFANHADCVSFIQFCASFPLPPTSEGGGA